MADSLPLQTPLTESISDDILLLSTFLSGRHGTPPKSSPVDENMTLFSDISTLLTISNHHDHQALNFTAVFGQATVNSIDFLVYVEDAVQPLARVNGVHSNRIDGIAENDQSFPSLGGSMHATTDPAYVEGHNSGKEKFADLVCITPKKENGRRLLLQWDAQMLDRCGVQLQR